MVRCINNCYLFLSFLPFKFKRPLGWKVNNGCMLVVIPFALYRGVIYAAGWKDLKCWCLCGVFNQMFGGGGVILMRRLKMHLTVWNVQRKSFLLFFYWMDEPWMNKKEEGTEIFQENIHPWHIVLVSLFFFVKTRMCLIR